MDEYGVKVFVGPATQLEVGSVSTGAANVRLEPAANNVQRAHFTIPAPSQDLVDAANTAALQSTQAVSAAKDAVSAAQAAVTAVPLKIQEAVASGNFRGAPGAPGRDGSNVLPTQDAVVQAQDLVDPLAVRDGVTNTLAALQAADAAAVAAGTALVLRTGVHRVTGSVTLNAQIVLQPGAILKPSNGTVITINGSVDVPARRFIDMSLGGVVVPANVPTFLPEWWGPTGTADDSETWRAMLKSATYISTYQSVTPRAGVNRVWQLDLTNVHIEGKGRTRRFLPPTTATAGDPLTGTGYMVKLGGATTIDGGVWDTGGIAGITLIFWTGHRCWVTNAHIKVSGANTVGVWVHVLGGSITPKITNTFVEGNLNQPSGVGIRFNSPDGELTNVTVAYCRNGVELLRGSTVLHAVHVWDCLNYGVFMNGANLTRFVACYIETNRSWGIYAEGCSHVVLDQGTYIWKNGNGVPGTGGMIMKGPGGATSEDNIINGTWNDNYGTNLRLESVDRTTGTMQFFSHDNGEAQRLNGTSTANVSPTVTGLYVDNASVGTDVKILSPESSTAAKPYLPPVTGKLVDNQNGQHTNVDLGTRFTKVNTPVVFGLDGSSIYSSGYWTSVFLLVGKGHIGTFDSTLYVEAPTNEVLRVRTRIEGGAAGFSGYFAVGNEARNITSDGSTNIQITTSGALQAIRLRGYIDPGTVNAQIAIQVGFNSNTGTTTPGKTGTVRYADLTYTRQI